MNNILLAVIVLSVLGAIFGLVLAIAAKVFEVKQDERVDKILEVLPGANCGGCGYAGCRAYAVSITEGKAPVNACVVGGSPVAASIAGIMGVEAKEVESCVALVKCSGGPNAAKKYEYLGLHDCLSASRLNGGGALECPSGCLGLGSCAAACPFGAIGVTNGLAKVDNNKCTGCMSCAAACPRNIIVKVPKLADITVACSSKDKGSVLSKYCVIGCIACRLCEKACAHDAIRVVDNLAVIDYTKCVSCGACAQKCPRHLIRDAHLETANDIAVS